jgi:hypothetical protein
MTFRWRSPSVSCPVCAVASKCRARGQWCLWITLLSVIYICYSFLIVISFYFLFSFYLLLFVVAVFLSFLSSLISFLLGFFLLRTPILVLPFNFFYFLVAFFLLSPLSSITFYAILFFVYYFISFLLLFTGACGSVVNWGTMLQARRSQIRFPMWSLDFFNWPNPSCRTMALGSTRPLTEMSTRNLPTGKA